MTSNRIPKVVQCEQLHSNFEKDNPLNDLDQMWGLAQWKMWPSCACKGKGFGLGLGTHEFPLAMKLWEE